MGLCLLTACNSTDEAENSEEESTQSARKPKKSKASASGGHWKGSFSNGMKGATISFDIAGDQLSNLTFEGYWRCDGKLDLTTLGPEESFTIEGNKVDGVIIEPKDGPAPFRYELHGNMDGDEASGTFRLSNIPAGCDTYVLNWTAEKQ